MQKVVAKDLKYLYDIPKSDGDKLVFLDLTTEVKEYPDGSIDISAFRLDDNGEIKPYIKTNIKPRSCN